MKFSVLTLFPDSLTSMLDASILGRARAAGLVSVDTVDLRAFSTNKHHTVDDTPCGGGAGMVLRVDVVKGCLDSVKRAGPVRTVLVDARGRPFTQADARAWSKEPHIAVLCGRYEGVDARALAYVDDVVSIGDYVLTGGELAALVIIDAVARLVPGVLGNEESSAHESHGDDKLLEHRQYTRPIVFDGQAVPPVLLSGNHKAIDRARRKDSVEVTAKARPDLLAQAKLTRADDKLLAADDVQSLDPVPSTAESESPAS